MAKMADLNEHIQKMIKAGSTLVIEDLEEHCGYTRISNVVLRNPDISEIDKIVYALIRSFAFGDKINAFPGQDRLAQYIGKRRETVNASLNRLKKHGLIDWIRRGMGETNIYIIKKLPEEVVLAYINREAEFEKQQEDKKTLASLMKNRAKEITQSNSTDVSLDAHQSRNPAKSTDVCLDAHQDVSLDAHQSKNPAKSTDVCLDTHQTDVSLDTHHDVSLDAHKEYKYKNTSVKTTTTEKEVNEDKQPSSTPRGEDNVVVVNGLEPDWHLIMSHLQVGDTATLQRVALALGISRPDFVFSQKAKLAVEDQLTYLIEQWTYKPGRESPDQTNTSPDVESLGDTGEDYPQNFMASKDLPQKITQEQKHKSVIQSGQNKISQEEVEDICTIIKMHLNVAVKKEFIQKLVLKHWSKGGLEYFLKTLYAVIQYAENKDIKVEATLTRALEEGWEINSVARIKTPFKYESESMRSHQASNKKRSLMRSMYS